MLSALAVLLLGTLSVQPPPIVPPAPPGIEILKILPPTRLRSKLSIPAKLSASGMTLVDIRSGQELSSFHAAIHRPPASLTKIMTALLILERHTLTETVTIPSIADHVRGSTVGLKAGEHMTVESLLRALLIPSANDAAYALAVYDAGTVKTFVERMNARAASLGLRNTHFTNPAGLDAEEQYSSPRDLAWLTMAALKNTDFRSIVGMRSATIATLEGRSLELRNTNELLHEHTNVFGVKTGTTDGAGECLISLFEEQGEEYLLVLLGSRDRYTDSLYILDEVKKILAGS
jgi:serine-type D-Ala-D-Ala carboxypeptidase (penicillin-binding protein 5/6)